MQTCIENEERVNSEDSKENNNTNSKNSLSDNSESDSDAFEKPEDGTKAETLEEMLYSGLEEEKIDDLSGWKKVTVDYVMSNERKVKSRIRVLAKRIQKRNVQSADIDDLFIDLMLYLYKTDDYNVEKAIERSSTGNIVSLDGYINVCIKFCVLRWCKGELDINRNSQSDRVINSDNTELSLFDTIADEKAEVSMDNVIYNLEDLLKGFEFLRYKFGPDMYLVWYVRLITLDDKTGKKFNRMLDILGIGKMELVKMSKSLDCDIMESLAKGVELAGVDKSKELFKKYVYSVDKIDSVLLQAN